MKTIENNIRLKASLIYIIVAIACCGIVLYLYNQRQNINNQKENIEQYYQTLSLTNKLVHLVNNAQSEANLYVISRESDHLTLFEQRVAEVEQTINSLKIIEGAGFQSKILNNITSLLEQKGNIGSELNNQFTNQNLIDSISEKLQRLDPVVRRDSILVTTTLKDTVVINIIPQKRFWNRLANVFSPDKSFDTIVSVNTLQNVDTIKFSFDDVNNNQNIISEINEFAAQASFNYSNQIAAIAQQINQLILTDQEITVQISNLLNQLSSQTISATLVEIQKSEQLIRRNYTVSIVGGSLSMILIMTLILLIIGDVNKGHAARKALELANKKTRQIMESRHQLLLSVSHDIKSPLGSMLGYLELWQNDKPVAQNQIASMHNSGKHILSLLDNLLEFSSLEQGTLVVSDSYFNLGKLCAETAEMFTPLALRKNLRFNSDYSFDDNFEVYSDELKIKQIIINILSNAVKYTSSGSVSFKAAYLYGKIYFRVSDTGAGIPDNQINTLFEPFARIEKNNALASGSGLGMYVVKGLIELLQGEINVVSNVGEGTTVEIAIPAKFKIEQESAATSPKNILVVDDDEAILSIIGDMLAKLGHKVSSFNNPKQIRQDDIIKHNIVITDMEMDSSSGTDVLRKVRDTGKDINVYIMTGRSDFNINKASGMGFDGFLPKPFTMEALTRLIEGCRNKTTGAFASLEEMFDGDQEAIAGVLRVFANTTTENIAKLREAVDENDFQKTQSLCHKMLPMFMQVEANIEAVGFLKQMDALRSSGEKEFPLWKEKTLGFIGEAGKLVEICLNVS